MTRTYSGITIEYVTGNAAGQTDITAIVNAANGMLQA